MNSGGAPNQMERQIWRHISTIIISRSHMNHSGFTLRMQGFESMNNRLLVAIIYPWIMSTWMGGQYLFSQDGNQKKQTSQIEQYKNSIYIYFYNIWKHQIYQPLAYRNTSIWVWLKIWQIIELFTFGVSRISPLIDKTAITRVYESWVAITLIYVEEPPLKVFCSTSCLGSRVREQSHSGSHMHGPNQISLIPQAICGFGTCVAWSSLSASQLSKQWTVQWQISSKNETSIKCYDSG